MTIESKWYAEPISAKKKNPNVKLKAIYNDAFFNWVLPIDYYVFNLELDCIGRRKNELLHDFPYITVRYVCHCIQDCVEMES